MPLSAAAPGEVSLWRLLQVMWQRRQQDRSSRWSRERLAREQAVGLAALRRFVALRSPFYRRFHAGLEDTPLERLPILDKATLMDNFDALVTDRAIRLREVEQHLQRGDAAPYRGRYTVLSTSGTTGQRGVFLFDPHEWLVALGAITRPLAWGEGPRPWQRPRSALIASAAPWHYSACIGRSLATRRVPTLRLDAAQPLAELVDALNGWRPDLLAVYPSVLRQLADEQLAGRLHIAPRHIGTSAERLDDTTRQRAQQAFGRRVYDTYGATEYAPIATECAAGSLHLLEDRALIELVDERGRPVPPGEAGARLLLTVLDRRTQPLIRYEISDTLRERPGRCACGRPFRMVEAIDGRAEDTLRLAGTAIPPKVWHDALERLPARSWQVLQRDDAAVQVLLIGWREPQGAAALAGELSALLEARGARGVQVEVSAVDAPERGASGKAPVIALRRRSH
ncbi:MAG: phenylacetate--CoA ligase family protein [Piscinibacter sp.]|nr:phenylacetate--CoA ligase family protein [Piscinibacter sp.]